MDSIEELDEFVDRYGREGLIVTAGQIGDVKQPVRPSHRGAVDLNPPQRALLQQFVEAGSRGLLTSHVGPAVGKEGKGIRPALERFAKDIGLVTNEGAHAFEAVKRADGRGFKLVDVCLQTARAMLG